MQKRRQVRPALRMGLTWVAGLAICTLGFSVVDARGPSIGGGGARPGGGGGGARPGGGGGGISRPSGGGMSRPSGGGSMSRPSGGLSGPGGMGGAGSRPSLPSNRPSLGNVGASRPNLPNNISRPDIGNASRPSLGGIGSGAGLNLPNNGSSRPNFGGGPSFGNSGIGNSGIGNAGIGNSGIGNVNRPSLGNIGERPGGIQLPSTRPGSGGIAGLDRPGIGDRPGIDNRPGIGNRPGIDNRPGIGDRPRPENPIVNRPGAGGGGEQWRPGDNRPGNRPDRPIIGGGGNNRPGNGNGNIVIGGGNTIIGGGNNIGNGNGWGINNRPGNAWWSQNHNGNWNNNNWHNHWHDNWHNNCINNNYRWYNGCWNNNWGGGWYAPMAVGAFGWGLGSWYNSYAYGGAGYYNPYYVSNVAAVPFDYSQPVIVNYYSQDSYAPANTTVNNPAPNVSPQPPPQNDAAQEQFNQGLAEFKAGNYQQALPQFDAALRQLPKDPVVHEVRALNLFALGQYPQAAASLNALLATAPGMDWTTMSGLYGNVDDYKEQLSALEQHCKNHRDDAPAAFVLAYHYLVAGHQDAAINALKAVVRLQPKDVVAKRMLDSLSPPATATPVPPPVADPAATAAQTDLVGKWQAKAGDSVIDLTIGDDSKFTWKATTKGQPDVAIEGELTASSDTLILESKSQGSMIGRVKSVTPDKWQFAMAGGAANDAQLTFERARAPVER